MKQRKIRSVSTRFETREDGGSLYIEGYFAIFGAEYELWPGAVETVSPGAFLRTIGGDVRALCDHDTRLVLGRTKAGTLELKEDARGLWGRIKINQDDVDAMNLYSRVQRGDVDQCSFGFDIEKEEMTYRDDGSVHWDIKDVTLYEVSVVTFPAYEETSVKARKQEFTEINKRKLDLWKEQMRSNLKGENHGA